MGPRAPMTMYFGNVYSLTLGAIRFGAVFFTCLPASAFALRTLEQDGQMEEMEPLPSSVPVVD